MGRQGEGRGFDRLHHQPGQQEPRDHRRRSRGEIRPRHPGDADLVAARQLRHAGARQRHHGAADQAERRGQRHRQISRPARRQMARRSRLHRQPDQGPLLPHRPDEEVRQYRRAGNVSGRQPAQGGQLDHRYLPEGGGSLPQGRLSRSASGSARPPTTSIPPARSSWRSAPNWSMPRATSRSRPTRCGRRSNSTRS